MSPRDRKAIEKMRLMFIAEDVISILSFVILAGLFSFLLTGQPVIIEHMQNNLIFSFITLRILRFVLSKCIQRFVVESRLNGIAITLEDL